MKPPTWRERGTVALVVLGCVVAALGTLAVIAAGFALSFDAIRSVGISAGVSPDIAWLLPVSIDGAMMVATITAIVLRFGDRVVVYPWLVVIVGVVVSVLCNAAHARIKGGTLDLPPDVAMGVSAIPAVTLFLSVHLLITLALAVIAKPRHVEPVTDMPADTPAVLPVLVDVAPRPVEPAEVPEINAGGGQSGVSYTAEQARRIALSLRATEPDMPRDTIAALVGRSDRTVKRWFDAADAERVTPTDELVGASDARS